MNTTFKKIWNIIAWCLVGIVVVLAVLLAGIRLFGLQVFTVLSGSMEPVYKTGSLIYVKKADTDELEIGDVITFMLSKDTVATHRIVGMVPSEEDPSLIRFRTKGDVNEAEDGTLVHPQNIVGKPIFTIPYLGYLASFIQNPPGNYIAISAGAILVLLVFLPDLLDENESKSNSTTDKWKKKKTLHQKSPRPSTQQVSKSPKHTNVHTKSQVPPQPPQQSAKRQPTNHDLLNLTPGHIEQLRQKLTPEQMDVLLARIAEARIMEQQRAKNYNIDFHE